MDLQTYIDGARRTESSKQPLHEETTKLGLSNRMLHAIVGITTEMGEISEAYEKTDLDFVNIAEEIGDAYWYTAVLFDELNITNVDMPADAAPLDCHTIPKHLISQGADMLDKAKKTMFYGKTFDEKVLHDQICRFYITLGLFVEGLKEELNVTKEKIWTINLDKLRARYPEKFDMTDAEVRDLKAERVILESIKK